MQYEETIREYEKATGKTVPAIIIMINGFDSFSEAYPDYAEILTKYTRECPRFGIYFMITASGTNSVRFKLSQNFKLVLGLELNDKSDYYSILGKTTITPSKGVGRGLVKVNDVIYEFQTAHPSKKEDSSIFFRTLAEELKLKYKTKAIAIPVLPDKVNMNLFKNKIDNLNNVPIGIYKDTLDTCIFDFKKNFFNKITGSDIDNTSSFVKELLSIFNSINIFKTYLLDSNGTISETYLNINKYSNNFDSVITSLNDSLSKIYEELKTSNFDQNVISKYQPILLVINGFDNFKSKLTIDISETMNTLYEIFAKTNLIHIIVIDSIDNFKKYEFETWFKTINVPDHAIWIGEGISNQFSIKLVRSSDRALQTPITNEFGYCVVNGKHALIKVLEFDSKTLEEKNKEIEKERQKDVEEL